MCVKEIDNHMKKARHTLDQSILYSTSFLAQQENYIIVESADLKRARGEEISWKTFSQEEVLAGGRFFRAKVFWKLKRESERDGKVTPSLLLRKLLRHFQRNSLYLSFFVLKKSCEY